MRVPLISTIFLSGSGFFNEKLDYVVGPANAGHGAVILFDDIGLLDLRIHCGTAECPSILIFGGQQWGTVNIRNCRAGRQYLLVNRSHVDLGIVVQEEGGLFGSKPISRFEAVTCFCTPIDVSDRISNDPNDPVIFNPSGALLCR